MAEKYDIVVIGSGPAGYTAAIRAAKLGKRVAVIDRGGAGGVSVHAGCVPVGVLLHWTDTFYTMQTQGPEFGFDARGVTVDWEKLIAAKDAIVHSAQVAIIELFKRNNITLVSGSARFVSPHMVEVIKGEGRETLEGKDLIIATGALPLALPFLPFDETKVLSSTGALNLKKVPKSMIIIGGGTIGAALASIYTRLKTKVTLFEKQDRLCSGMDLALAKLLENVLSQEGIGVHLDAEVVKAKPSDGTVSVIVSQGKQSSVYSAEAVLVTVGRKPQTEGLGLEEIGVEYSNQGYLFVNDEFRTNVPNIFAIGDVIEGIPLAHRAAKEGFAVAEIIAGRRPRVNYMAIPHVVYTSPPVASVGLLESEARDIKIDVCVGASPFKANARSRCSGIQEGLVKIVGDKATGRLIGMHIIGPDAAELINEGVIALEKRASVQDLADVCLAHPTFSEAIHEAALAALGEGSM